MRVGAGIAVTLMSLLALGGCSGTTAEASHTISPPPAGASAAVVLDTYLRALAAGDCTTAHALATPTFSVGNGELCGEVEVSAYSVGSHPATPSSHEAVFSTVLTTDGSSDGTIEPGKTTWFYELKRHGGEWRLVGGGTGP